MQAREKSKSKIDNNEEIDSYGIIVVMIFRQRVFACSSSSTKQGMGLQSSYVADRVFYSDLFYMVKNLNSVVEFQTCSNGQVHASVLLKELTWPKLCESARPYRATQCGKMVLITLPKKGGGKRGQAKEMTQIIEKSDNMVTKR